MFFNGMYIPDLIADEVMGSLYQGRAVPNIKKTSDKDQPPGSTPPAEEPKDPTTTILWVGALASAGGFTIQFINYMSEKNKR